MPPPWAPLCDPTHALTSARGFPRWSSEACGLELCHARGPSPPGKPRAPAESMGSDHGAGKQGTRSVTEQRAQKAVLVRRDRCPHPGASRRPLMK